MYFSCSVVALHTQIHMHTLTAQVQRLIASDLAREPNELMAIVITIHGHPKKIASRYGNAPVQHCDTVFCTDRSELLYL